MNYKNSITGEIISFTSYLKLPLKKQQEYFEVTDIPTHSVYRFKDDFILYPLRDKIAYQMIEGLNDSSGGAYDGF